MVLYRPYGLVPPCPILLSKAFSLATSMYEPAACRSTGRQRPCTSDCFQSSDPGNLVFWRQIFAQHFCGTTLSRVMSNTMTKWVRDQRHV